MGGINFFMVYNKKDVPCNLGNAQIVVFGHSHQYFMQQQNGGLGLDSGICGRRRFDQEIIMVTITIEGKKYDVEKLEFQP